VFTLVVGGNISNSLTPFLLVHPKSADNTQGSCEDTLYFLIFELLQQTHLCVA
jgi:hypothetical protein